MINTRRSCSHGPECWVAWGQASRSRVQGDALQPRACAREAALPAGPAQSSAPDGPGPEC